MEEFKADILSINKKGRLLYYSLLSIILLAIAALILLQVIPFVLQIFTVLFWIFAIIQYVLQSKKQILKKSTGQLKITTGQIVLKDKSLSLSEIQSIKIFISGWKSYKRSNDRQKPISDLHHGDKNILTLISNNETIKIEFLLNSFEHWQLLREQVLHWYRKNINISESGNSGRTYGLESLLYSEIQEFKKQIHTSKTGT